MLSDVIARQPGRIAFQELTVLVEKQMDNFRVTRATPLSKSPLCRVSVQELERLSLQAPQRPADSGALVVEHDRSLQVMGRAHQLADAICIELADWEDTDSFAAVMPARRGRAWFP